MLKAHSLLYAVYVCLIVSIICGALLFFANLYNQLNLFYNTREALYIQNQSALNYTLGNSLSENNFINEKTGAQFSSEISSFGLLHILKVKNFNATDTIQSAHFVGNYSNAEEMKQLARDLINFEKKTETYIPENWKEIVDFL